MKKALITCFLQIEILRKTGSKYNKTSNPLSYDICFKEYRVNFFILLWILISLKQVINTIVDIDLAYIASYNSGTAVKVKKLLGVIAESVPFKPNIASLARKLDLSRDSVYQYIYQLQFVNK
jgi:hypothetical protein